MEFVKFGGEGGRGYIASGAEATVITLKRLNPEAGTGPGAGQPAAGMNC